MFTLCYYAAIMLPLNVYYVAINLSFYYAAVMLVFNVYYILYIIYIKYINIPGDRPEKDLNGTLTLWPFEI